MHQAHNIPWHLIDSNFKFIRENKRLTPPISGLFSKKNPNADKELKHFVKKFAATIHSFAETERKKYSPNFAPLHTGKVFSDELRDKYPEHMNERNQAIEYWIVHFESHWNYGELMDIVNILLYENEMEPLLMLAQHPQVRIRGLHGFCRAQVFAVAAYMRFNAADATGTLENGEYTLFHGYEHFIQELCTRSYSYQMPHIAFLRECGAYQIDCSAHQIQHAYVQNGFCLPPTLVHNDYEKLQEYLKTLFAIMYRYDILAREVGLDPNWEVEIARSYPLRGHVKMQWVEAEHKQILV